MAAVHINESTSIIHHAINNRLNTLTLGMSYLENKNCQESQTVLHSLKMELRDLQDLIEQLKHHNP